MKRIRIVGRISRRGRQKGKDIKPGQKDWPQIVGWFLRAGDRGSTT